MLEWAERDSIWEAFLPQMALLIQKGEVERILIAIWSNQKENDAKE